MNQYQITLHLKTHSKILTKLDKTIIHGFEFSNFDSTLELGPDGGWVVKGDIEAITYTSAWSYFKDELYPLISKISFLIQGYISMGGSVLIYKVNENPLNQFIYYRVDDIQGVGLWLCEKHLTDLDKMQDCDINLLFIEYIHQSNNAVHYYSRLSLLCSSLESLSGKVEKVNSNGVKYITYNKKNMKTMLGNEMFGRIFGDSGLRHKIQHGDSIKEFDNEDYINKIYKKIFDYCNAKFNLNIDTSIINSGRNPFGNKKGSYYQLFAENTDLIDLGSINTLKLPTIDGLELNGYTGSSIDLVNY